MNNLEQIITVPTKAILHDKGRAVMVPSLENIEAYNRLCRYRWSFILAGLPYVLYVCIDSVFGIKVPAETC